MTAYIGFIVFISVIFYAAAGISYLGSERSLRMAITLSIMGFLANLCALVLRIMISGRLPVSNGSEFLLCFASITVLGYFLYSYTAKSRHVGAVIMFIAMLLNGSILVLMPTQLISASPLMPALKSPWLTIHVVTAIIAYAGFALAAGVALIRLVRKHEGGSAGDLYKIIAVSFAFLTLTIVFGGIWAEEVWGRYWNWDPKETWAFITWIIYAAYLHFYRRKIWTDQMIHIMVVVGFIAVLFTYYGVNYLLPSLHSYN